MNGGKGPNVFRREVHLDGHSPPSLTLAEPWKITTIAEALPGYNYSTIRAMLQKCRGDIDNAFSKLLDSDPSTLSFPSPSPSPSPSANNSNAMSIGSTNLFPSSRPYLGSSSRSSSRHSTASKRSADDSDFDEGGSIRP